LLLPTLPSTAKEMRVSSPEAPTKQARPSMWKAAMAGSTMAAMAFGKLPTTTPNAPPNLVLNLCLWFGTTPILTNRTLRQFGQNGYVFETND
jgi:hypothetical protein